MSRLSAIAMRLAFAPPLLIATLSLFGFAAAAFAAYAEQRGVLSSGFGFGAALVSPGVQTIWALGVSHAAWRRKRKGPPQWRRVAFWSFGVGLVALVFSVVADYAFASFNVVGLVPTKVVVAALLIITLSFFAALLGTACSLVEAEDRRGELRLLPVGSTFLQMIYLFIGIWALHSRISRLKNDTEVSPEGSERLR